MKLSINRIDQFRLLNEPILRTVKQEADPPLSINDNDENISIKSEKFEFVFNKKEKIVQLYKVEGYEFISKGFVPQHNFIQNDAVFDFYIFLMN